jgi:two-component system, OmpR family, sensor histidine kinase ChvG
MTSNNIPKTEAIFLHEEEKTRPHVLVALWQLIKRRATSSLSRRIVLLNLAGLIALLIGLLYLNQFREGLIEARVQSLLTQGDIIAGAIAASATVEPDTIAIDPDRLLQMQAGETSGLGDEVFAPLEFSLNPEKVASLLRRLVTPTRTRARLYDREGMLLLDTRSLYSKGDIIRLDLPPLQKDVPSFLEKSFKAVQSWWQKHPQRIPEAFGPTDGKLLPEVAQAMTGKRASDVRLNEQGETIVSVAVPVQRFNAVRGTLLLSTQGSDIDAIIASERYAMLQVFVVAAAVMTALSLLLAGTIAGPVHRLAEAAERVRQGTRTRVQIPDLTGRSDEIGHLSGALRDMTQALYGRIDAIESFAADVAHELKNPLTSLRSAVETLPVAKTEASRERLLGIIHHDVRRLDRLISDISDASRLDAELSRTDDAPVNLLQLVQAIVSLSNDVRREGEAAITLHVSDQVPYMVFGHDGRLGQVIRNLLDNARSFSPENGNVRVYLKKEGRKIILIVEDDGPGIPSHALERIFERFYTDRPEQGFGQNSGLGLSISRQIVEAHKGTIRAENRPSLDKGSNNDEDEEHFAGARLIVQLPSMIDALK